MKAVLISSLMLIASALGAHVPTVAIEGLSVDLTAQRQVVLDKILNHVTARVESNPRQESISTSTKSVYESVQALQHDACDGTVSAADEKVFAAVLAHAATSEGKTMFATLQSDPAFEAAEQMLSANRQEECRQVQRELTQLSNASTSCLCDPTKSYSYCRMLLAHEANLLTQDTQSTASKTELTSFQEDFHAQAPVKLDTTPLAVYGNSSVRALQATNKPKGFVYDALSGSFMADACIGEGTQICVKGGVVGPTYNMLTNAGQYILKQCSKGSCKDINPMDLVAIAGDELANTRLEVGVSLCLGVTGLTQLMRKFGVSLCVNLLTLEAFLLQGPLGQASVGASAVVLKVSAFVKVKMAEFSPLCPQDFLPAVQKFACANPQFYQAFVTKFANQPYCNLKMGQTIVGATATVDLWFWRKSYQFMTQPTPRPVFKC